MATGVSLQLKGDCLSEAKSTIVRRAEAVGVGNPVFTENAEGMLFSLTLPSIPNAKVDLSQSC